MNDTKWPASYPIAHRLCLLLFCFFTGSVLLQAQTSFPLYSRDTKTDNRAKLYKNLVGHGITKNLSYPLTDSTEENWTDAFWAMELIRYRAPWVESQLATAVQDAPNRSVAFQRACWNCCTPIILSDLVQLQSHCLIIPGDDKIFAMCAEYLLIAKPTLQGNLATKTTARLKANPGSCHSQPA